MSNTAEQAAWLLRVLGVAAGGDAGAATSAQPVVRLWGGAKDAVDQQLGALYTKLRKTGLPVLGKVADEIEAVLGNFRVGLTTALMNYDAATGPKREAARIAALKMVEDYKSRLATDKHVIAADTNPFGVQVTARTTLGKALDTLSARMQSA
jgi:hypothetical protein